MTYWQNLGQRKAWIQSLVNRRNSNHDVGGGFSATQCPLMERRQQERRVPEWLLRLAVSIDIQNRRLGLGRRWDDWRRKQ
jgi:hypothetical protein